MPSNKEKTCTFQAKKLAGSSEELQGYLRVFAEELAEEVAGAAPDRTEEVLRTLIAELALTAADQRRRKERRQKQAEGIEAAKARGVQFGRRTVDLPEHFEETHLAWRNGQLSLREAAGKCHMAKSTFYNIAVRIENAAECTQC